MTVKGQIRRVVERIARAHIFYRVLPTGIHLTQDIRHWLPNLKMRTIFDVGANTGQSVAEFVRYFPEAEIHCFEPVAETFLKLQEAFGSNDRVRCVQVAFAASGGSGRMIHSGTPDLYYLTGSGANDDSSRQDSSEVVVTRTLDEYCADERIDRISFLKIDTEGGDFEVLKGGAALLSNRRVDLVEVEAGMNPRNTRHVPLEPMKAFLETQGYLLFGLYEQVREWPTGCPNLRRANAVFVSETVIDENCKGRRQ